MRMIDGARGQAWRGIFRRALLAALLVVPLAAHDDGAAHRAVTPAVGTPVPVAGQYDYAGLLHLHTALSDDATGDYDQLARLAAANGLAFLIVTDHNTFGAGRAGEGRRHGVLMLTGMEASRPEGHLLAMGSERAPTDPKTSTDAFLATVRSEDGMSVLAHPTHRKWRWEGPLDDRIDGLEIIDLADLFYASSTGDKVATVAALGVVGPTAYLRLSARPDEALRMWDAVGSRRRFVGVYAPDIHQAVELWEGAKLPFPPADQIMRLARNHILVDHPLSGDLIADRAAVLDALKAGRVYVGLDILGDAGGFRFTARTGKTTARMGMEIPVEGETAFEVRSPSAAAALEATIRLLRDGVVVAQSTPGASTLRYGDRRPGVYRVEVVVPRKSAPQAPGETIWIYSNPIYLRASGILRGS